MISPDNSSTREQAARIVASGGIVAFRTDTFYGLGADPLNKIGINKIKTLKGRDAGKPILLLVSDRMQVSRFVSDESSTFRSVADLLWPGPITLIGKARRDVPTELTADTACIGVRLPDNDRVREFVRHCGGALTATSANASGGPPARTAKDVEDYFPAGIDLIVDSGEVSVNHPSTVLDLSSGEPRLVREGEISFTKLERVLNELGFDLRLR